MTAAPVGWRPTGTGTGAYRAGEALWVAGATIVAVVTVMPAAVAIVATHKYREPIGAPPGAAYRTVSFAASDGL